MKTLNKTVLATTIAMLISPATFAGNIQSGTTGYAAKIVNGKEVVIAQTFNQGIMPETLPLNKVVPSSNMPENFQTINQDSVGMVKFDSKTLTSLKVGEKVKLDYLGNEKDGKVINTVNHENGDNTMVASTGSGERTILTFGANGSVVGTASVDGHNYDVSTDANGNTWMVDNTTSGQTHAGFENDTHVNTLGAAISTTPTVAPVVPVVTSTSVPNIQLLVYISTTIPNGTTIVNNLIATTNQAYVDSNVKMKVVAAKIVSVVDQYPLSEATSLSTLRAGTNSFTTLAADKLSSKADLVTFIHPLKIAQGMCGLAYLNGGSGVPFSKTNIYSVVSYGSDGGSYCNNWTLAHELGHTMGMVHDVAHSVGVTGHFADSFGYGLASTYGDIMSYFPVNGVFSSPNKYWNNSSRFPYGLINKADVARGLNVIAPEVALFHTITK